MINKIILFNKLIREFKIQTPGTRHSWKYFFSWLKTLDPTKTSLDYGLPWFTFQAIDHIKKVLPAKAKVFEFGGGGSTAFFTKYDCEVFTVEHDAAWFKNIEAYIADNKKSEQWKGFLIKADEIQLESNPQKADPLHYCSDDKDYLGKNFKNYASKIDDYQNEYFDLVLIDGRARPSCVYHSINKIKKGGLLVLDNTERPYYTEYFENNFSEKFIKEVDVFGPVPYTMWFHKTTIWRKK